MDTTIDPDDSNSSLDDMVLLVSGEEASRHDPAVVELIDGEFCWRDDASELIGGGFVADSNPDYVRVWGHDGCLHVDRAVWSDHLQEYIHEDDAVMLHNDDHLPCDHPDLRESVEGHWFVSGDDDFVQLEDGDWACRENTFLCEDCGDRFHDDSYGGNGMCESCFERNETASDDPSVVHDYHECSIEVEVRRARTGSPLDNWTVGFELERSASVYSGGDRVPVTPLFAYWEEDGSCGIEGVTHAYSVSHGDLFRRHVEESRRMINLDTNDRCGGHTTLAGPGLTLEQIRRYAGLTYALWRRRLNNRYCNGDKGLAERPEGRYAVIRRRFHRPDSNAYEFRLCSRVHNARQLVNRFEFFGLLANALHHQLSFRAYLRSNAKLLRRIYPDKEQRNEIRTMAWHFHRYLQEGVAHPSIAEYLG